MEISKPTIHLKAALNEFGQLPIMNKILCAFCQHPYEISCYKLGDIIICKCGAAIGFKWTTMPTENLSDKPDKPL